MYLSAKREPLTTPGNCKHFPLETRQTLNSKSAPPAAPVVVLPGRPPRVDAGRPGLLARLEVGVLLVALAVAVGELALALGQERLLLRRQRLGLEGESEELGHGLMVRAIL